MIVLVSERTHTSVFLNDWSRVRECVGSVLWQWVRDMAESQSILRYAMQSDPPRRSEPVRRAQPVGGARPARANGVLQAAGAAISLAYT